jgi:glycerol-3-phosphate dehydrogenase (NAD(P)+)
LQLARNGQTARLWGHRAAYQQALIAERCNRRYLPEAPFPPALQPVVALADAVHDADALLVAVPSRAFRDTLAQLLPLLDAPRPLLWACKGLEQHSGRFLHDVAIDVLGTDWPTAIVSGPSFAAEVAAGLPTAITVASTLPAVADAAAALLHGNSFRVYTSADVVGVELGGAAKNVIAVATGISDGLGFGANARAALVTRGLAEIVRLGVAVGAGSETLIGLAGLGDLLLTCTDDQSRNRRFGLAIGRGATPAQAQVSIAQVVEGAGTARELRRLAARHAIEMPITEQVDDILHAGVAPLRAVRNLLEREARADGV